MPGRSPRAGASQSPELSRYAPPDPLPKGGTSSPRELASEQRDALEELATTLTASGQYRVLRRFARRERYEADPGAATRTAVFVDVETTGRDTERDAIIELAVVPFEYDPGDGRIFAVGPAVEFLEDPGRPIPEEVVAMTGITDEMVGGRRIDDAAVEAALGSAVLAIAHNAAFDRAFVARRLPVFARMHWACSQREVPWHLHGCGGTKLEYLLIKSCAEYFDAHRAAEDCYAGIHLLATPTCNGARPMKLLLDSARRTVRLTAMNSEFEVNSALKARGYRWEKGARGRAKGWWIDVVREDAQAECEWLREVVYGGGAANIRRERVTAVERWAR